MSDKGQTKQDDATGNGGRVATRLRAGSKMTRRTFNKVLAGTGVALAMGSLPSGCGGSSSPPPDTEHQSLHFSFSDLIGSANTILDAELQVRGTSYAILPHTAETLRQTAARQLYAGGAADSFTHYVPDVELSAEKPHVLSVTFTEGTRGPGPFAGSLPYPDWRQESGLGDGAIHDDESSAFRAGMRRQSGLYEPGPGPRPVSDGF